MTKSSSPLRVLVDGDHHSQPGGTGIATYSRTLVTALQTMGHQPIRLSGAAAPRQADALVDEASVADTPVVTRGLRLQLETASHMLSGLAHSHVTARRVTPSGAVLASDGANPAVETLLAPHIYVDAHYRHMLSGQFTDVRPETKVDVLHLSAPLPIRMRGVRSIVTIHDLVPVRLPWTTTDNKREFIHRARRAAAIADLVITVSESSRQDIVDLLGVDARKVAVTYQPSDLRPLTEAEQESIPRVLKRFGLEPGGYALFTGAIEPKKNLRRLIEAFVETKGDAPLVIVGRKAWKWEGEVADLDTVLGEAARKRLRFLGYTGREDLRRLYAGARAFLFPSLFEGFGLPALEALTAGRPTLVSRAGSLPEVCGDAAVYCDALDRDSIRAGIETVMTDESVRERLCAAGPVQAKRFSMEAYVAKLTGAYARLA